TAARWPGTLVHSSGGPFMKSGKLRSYRVFAWVIACVCLCRVQGTTAQATRPADVNLAYFRAHYTKYEFKIPMRDGVKLFTAIYAPKDDSKPYPILLSRTPYSVKPYGEDL